MALKLLSLFTCILLLPNCEEKLPPRNEPLNVFVGVIQAVTKRTAVCNNGLPQRPLNISIGVRNIFDETLQDTKDIKVTLSIWPKNWPAVRKTLTFESSDSEEWITIEAGQTYWVNMEWDHLDAEGTLIWKAIHAPPITKYGYEIKFRVVGTIQIFNKIPSVPTTETEFPIVYYFEEKC